MHSNKTSFFIITLLLSILLAAASPYPLRAEPYDITEPVFVKSVYTERGKDKREQSWEVRKKEGDAGQTLLEFFPGGSNKPFSTVSLASSGQQVSWSRYGSKQVKTGKNGIVLLGIPSPASVVFPRNGEITVSLTAGGSRFIKKYRVEAGKISYGKAVQAGWLPTPEKPDKNNSTINLIRVYDSQDNPVTTQLWEENQDWWLFEETPYRRSVRVEEKLP